MLSEVNKERARSGKSLIIDEEWIRLFPQDRPFQGQTIPVQDVKMSAPQNKQDTAVF